MFQNITVLQKKISETKCLITTVFKGLNNCYVFDSLRYDSKYPFHSFASWLVGPTLNK